MQIVFANSIYNTSSHLSIFITTYPTQVGGNTVRELLTLYERQGTLGQVARKHRRVVFFYKEVGTESKNTN